MTAPTYTNQDPIVMFGPLSTLPQPSNVPAGTFFHATDTGLALVCVRYSSASIGGVEAFRWDPVEAVGAALGQTSGTGTLTLVITPTVAGAYSLYGDVTAFDAADPGGAWFQDQFGFMVTGGPPPTTVTMLGSSVQATGSTVIGAATAVYSNSGATLVLTVTGVTGKLIKWQARLRITGAPV